MYFDKTRCFQIGVLLWCSNISYIWQVYFWHQEDLGSDMDKMICMIGSLILWIFVVWKVYFRSWWIEVEFGRDSGQKEKVSIGVSQDVTTPCIYLANVDLLDWFALLLRVLAWAIIFTHWSFYVWNVNILHLLGDFIRLTLEKIYLGVFGGVAQRQVETPCLSTKKESF